MNCYRIAGNLTPDPEPSPEVTASVKVEQPSAYDGGVQLGPSLGKMLPGHGIEVRLISPQYVIPFVKTNKNDRNDAQALSKPPADPS